LKIGIGVNGRWRRAAKFAGGKQVTEGNKGNEEGGKFGLLRALRFFLFKIF
jgi:hypothetical protein